MALAELVKTTFDAARHSGAVVFTESERIKTVVNGVQYLITLAPALAKKPTKDDSLTDKPMGQDDRMQKKASPWDPVEPDLLVDGDWQKDYQLVLNKFAVVPRHFLMVTKQIKPQTAPLSPEDLAAAFKAISEANKSGIRHLGFFNCGEESGASIAHKHVQFMEFPEEFTPFVDELMAVNKSYKEGDRPYTDTRMSFAHFVVPTPAALDGDSLAFRYAALMGRVLTALRENDMPISYNFLFTHDWMMAVPRSSEKCEGRSINSVGVIGMLLAKSQEDMDFYQSKGPNEVQKEIALPPIDIEKAETEYDY